MKKIKKIIHEKEFDTMTIVTDIEEVPSLEDTVETVDRKTLADTRMDIAEGQPTQVYEPRPLTPDDDIYEDIIEQFASAPTKPKYWFEEFGDYWSCSCGHINKGDSCKSCGLERELLRSLFILHKPTGEIGKLDKKLKKSKEKADKEAVQYAEKENHRKEREASGEDLTKVVPIETAVTVQQNIKPKSKSKTKIAIAIAAVLILIGACGFAIYKHMAAPAMQYEEAVQLMEDGKYAEAIEIYTSLGDYKDSKAMIVKCHVLIGDKYYEEAKFEEAIASYETAMDLKKDDSLYEKIRLCYIGMGDAYLADDEYEKALGVYMVAAEIAPGDDVQEKINETKLAYVKAFMDDRTDQVEAYLEELVEADYPGAKELYDSYYAWHVSIVANTSESDYSTDKSTVSRKETVYFHTSLSGGEPEETIRLYYEVKWPDGHNEIYNLDSEWKSGDKISARFQYSIPVFGREGKLTFNLYNFNTKELLGSDSVTFKN
ncbi:MAG: hypothetical protein Q4B18_07175 [Bacillota bacterium]|nr:hypothetical protein [Bacillota bacterium]